VLDTCAELRGELRRWSRSPALAELRRSLEWFDKVSRSPHFWSDHQLAEEASQSASHARSLVDELSKLVSAAEAAEDLAVEAWYDRSALASESLRGELLGLRERFEPLPERVYLATRPRCERAALYVVAARGSWATAAWLVDSWAAWAERRGIHTRRHLATYIDPKLRPGTKPDDPAKAYQWELATLTGSESPQPGAAALELYGAETVALLEPEAGAHRLFDGSAHSVVRVLWAPGRDPKESLRPMELPTLLARLPSEELRRYSRPKETLKDARMDVTVPLHGPGLHRYDPTLFLRRWVRHACLRAEDASWT
jgi:hypothetical protein